MPEFVPSHAAADEATHGPHGGVHLSKALAEGGISTVFALCGAHILPLLDTAPGEGIRIVDVRHEGSATLAAEGWALATGEVGMAAVTAGPGFTNALTGVVDAATWNVPMLFFAGRTGTHQTGKGAVFDIPQAEILAPFIKRTVRCVDTGRVGVAATDALRHATTGVPGPVYLDVPQDVFMGRGHAPADDATPVGPPAEVARPAAAPGVLREVAELVERAERPVVVAGGGAHWARAGAALAHLAETAGIPIVTNSAGRGVVPDSHPWCLGTMIHSGIAVLEADLVIVLGSRFNANMAFGQPPLFAEPGSGQTVVQVDIDGSSLGGNRRPDVAVVSDATMFCVDLADAVNKVPDSREAWRETCVTNTAFVRSMWDTEIDGHTGERLHHGAVARDVVAWARESIGDAVTFVADGGDAMTWMISYAYAEGPGRLMATTTALGTLGVGMPFALAARAARPDEPVILFTGDGAFGLCAMEVDTAVRHDLAVIVIVSNNTGWRDVSHEHDMWFGEGKRYGSELADTRYDLLGESLGARGEWVQTIDQLRPALDRALAAQADGHTTVINVSTDAEVLSDLLRNVGDMGII